MYMSPRRTLRGSKICTRYLYLRKQPRDHSISPNRRPRMRRRKLRGRVRLVKGVERAFQISVRVGLVRRIGQQASNTFPKASDQDRQHSSDKDKTEGTLPVDSEAGPEVAQFSEEEFKTAADYFKEDLEFLHKVSSSQRLGRTSLGRCSLYLNFDPLARRRSEGDSGHGLGREVMDLRPEGGKDLRLHAQFVGHPLWKSWALNQPGLGPAVSSPGFRHDLGVRGFAASFQRSRAGRAMVYLKMLSSSLPSWPRLQEPSG
ncbi:uncharacterized protein [Dermacentor albipictus]|uniref:uncharacterized protein isoform X2 n=1 Tax=Dermacentor albipictus TaxID=60249 RepID=UPI0031FCFEF7